MNCPKCGLQPLAEQKFCRACGESLQAITQRLGDATLPVRSDPAILSSRGDNNRLSRLVLWGFIMMFVGAAVGVIGKKLLHQDIVTVVGILVSLAGMFLTAYPYLSPAPRRKIDSSQSSPTDGLNPSSARKDLPQGSNIEYTPGSITERTTDLLENSAATRPNKEEEGKLQS
jgi:hypothetical protein